MEEHSHPDQYILEGIKNKDRAVLKKLYADYFDLIRNLVLKNSGTQSDAEDIFQETLVAIYSKLQDEDIVLKSPFGGYLYAIARNLWLMQLRKKRNQEVTFNDVMQYDSNIEGIDVWMEKKEREAFYRRKFEELPSDCQRVLTMFFHKKTMEEIAETMGYSNAGYAKKKKFTCKSHLIRMIKNDDLYKEYAA